MTAGRHPWSMSTLSAPWVMDSACPALHRQQRLVHQALDLVEYLAGNDASPAHTAVAASRSKPPEKTDGRANS